MTWHWVGGKPFVVRLVHQGLGCPCRPSLDLRPWLDGTLRVCLVHREGWQDRATVDRGNGHP